MGICESANGGKSLANEEIVQKKSPEVDPNDQTFDYKNDNEQSGVRPSFFSKSEKMENINSLVQENKSNVKPELAKYDRSVYASGKSNSVVNKTSLMSSGVSEQEIIIKGEINPESKNKDEDFVNSSFKQLVENKGGKIIENGDNNPSESRKESAFELGKEIFSEINSSVSIPKPITEENNEIIPNNNINTVGNMNEIKEGIISGKYDNNGILIPNNSNIVINGRIDKKGDKTGDLFGKNDLRQKIIINHNSILKDSNKVCISLHESSPKIDSFLNVPKNDQPPPNIDELSESTLKNSSLFEN